jgi:DUF1680 family protein
MAERYKLTLNRVLHGTAPAYTQEFLLEDLQAAPGRRFTEFSGDLSGRYIGALATAAVAYKTDFPGLDDFVRKAIALQKPQGYFGREFHFDHPADKDLALLWGNGRLLTGLMEYYRYRPSAQVLACASRLGDFLLSVAPLMNSKEIREEFGAAHFASGYVCWTQQTEGLALLYAATKNAAYRELAEEIASRIERRPADHVHGYLTSLRGALEFQLQRCEDAWSEIMRSGDVLLTGGVPEAWSPKKLRTEGCAEADWIRLSLGLWRMTANAKYIDAAEKAIFNEFAMNQFSTGDFGHRVLTKTGVAGGGAARAWWCCTLHGLRCFPDIQANAFRVQGDTVHCDLPIDTQIDQDGFRAVATSTLATDGRLHLRVSRSSGERLLFVRQPPWAKEIRVTVNGKPAGREPLRAGDNVVVHYSMELRQELAGDRLTFSYGPWLLGAPESENGAYFNELYAGNKIVAGTQVSASEKLSGFGVLIAARKARFIPAEFPEQPGEVQLRAVAEQTSMPSTTWELAFLIA